MNLDTLPAVPLDLWGPCSVLVRTHVFQGCLCMFGAHAQLSACDTDILAHDASNIIRMRFRQP